MSNLFSKLFEKLKSSSGGSSDDDRAVGVDIGTSSIKLVELRRKGGKAILETYSTLALGPYASADIGATTNLQPDTLGKALADAIHEGNIVTKNAALSIPSSASLVFQLELPGGLKEKDLASIVPNEARRYIPVPISEVTLDYWEIPHHGESEGKPENQKSEVLVAAIQNEVLDRQRALAKNAGLSSDIFEIEVFSAIRSTLAHELSAVLLLDFGASRTKLAIVEYGIVRSFHIIGRGSADITTKIAQALSISFAQAEEMKREVGLTGEGSKQTASDVARLAVNYILSETTNAIKNFERKYEKPVSKVILSGAGSLMKGFPDYAFKAFRTETVIGTPFSKVEVPQFISDVLTETGPEFSIALGLALRKLG